MDMIIHVIGGKTVTSIENRCVTLNEVTRIAYSILLEKVKEDRLCVKVRKSRTKIAMRLVS